MGPLLACVLVFDQGSQPAALGYCLPLPPHSDGLACDGMDGIGLRLAVALRHRTNRQPGRPPSHRQSALGYLDARPGPLLGTHGRLGPARPPAGRPLIGPNNVPGHWENDIPCRWSSGGGGGIMQLPHKQKRLVPVTARGHSGCKWSIPGLQVKP